MIILVKSHTHGIVAAAGSNLARVGVLAAAIRVLSGN
jgi:hypothetical protein